jgi:UDP-N-acetylglucosamine--N-acetylmuramyl-(pentapeptide) pyrophosphoryl-undecaprenol N-acetylglucosamine transferase
MPFFEGKKMSKVLFAGGGTGGHVYPALALAKEFSLRGYTCSFVGTSNHIEARLVPEAAYDISFIWISGFQRSLKLSNLLFPIKLLVSLWQSYKILSKEKPKLVIGTGGYVSGPLVYMASKRGIPCLIQEQNSFPGITTKFLEKHVNEVHIAYNYARRFLKSDAVFVSGNPVRHFNLAKPPQEKRRLTVGIMGGSLGALSINRVIQSLLLAGHPIKAAELLWQTGKTSYNEFKDTEIEHGEISEYITDMADFYASADIIICRAGAISLAELAMAGKAAIIIPYKYAAEDHQTHNANVFKNAGAAFVFADDTNLLKNVDTALVDLLSKDELRNKMAANSAKLATPNATKEIVDHGIKLMEKLS